MENEVMTKNFRQNRPLLETLVDGFLAGACPLLLRVVFPGIGETLWALDMLEGFADVAIISLDAFAIFKMTQKRVAKDVDVWPRARGKWPVQPNDVAREDTKCNFISHCTLLELVGVKSSPESVGDPEVSPIISDEAIIRLVTQESKGKINLKAR